MDGQNYLNQISATARPTKKANSKLLSSPLFKIVIGGLAAFLVIMIVGSLISTGQAGLQSQSVSLKYHIDNTLSIISTYQSHVKSSDLRSSSASLYSILSNTNLELTNYLTSTYEYKDSDKTTYKTEMENSKLDYDALNQSLFLAKINGVLDKVYMSKMAYEISSIMSEEATIYNTASSSDLELILVTSYSSLKTLLPLFSDSTSTY